MTRFEESPTTAPRRPALIDELERMGFEPSTASPSALLPPEPQAPASVRITPEPAPPAPVASPPVASTPVAPTSVASPPVASPSGTSAAPRTFPAAAVTAAPVAAAGVAAGPPPATAAPAPTPAAPAAPPALTADTVLRLPKEIPTGGWRKAVFTLTFGQWCPGPSAKEQHDRELMARANRPVPGCWRIAVVSLKGGVGKTTTTAALGMHLATLRGDRVIAVDANPDRGTLAEKVPLINPATVRDLLRARGRITRYSDVRAFTSLSPSRLEVLASDADPTVSQALSEADYRDTIDTLEKFYSLILTDCGTGLLHSAMNGVLGLADSLVVVTSASLDGARSASATLDWLEAHGHAELVKHSVAVVNAERPRGGLVNVDAVSEHFAQRCRAVVRVPVDPHLEAGGAVSMQALRRPTRQAYLELAAAVGDGLP